MTSGTLIHEVGMRDGLQVEQQVIPTDEKIAWIERLADVVCACHLHDTYGMAMANAWPAMNAGVRYFEGAFGGLGGCPFTALAGGNLCTEDFVHMLQRDGHRRDISLDAISDVAREAGQFLGRQLPGFVHRTGAIGNSVAVATSEKE